MITGEPATADGELLPVFWQTLDENYPRENQTETRKLKIGKEFTGSHGSNIFVIVMPGLVFIGCKQTPNKWQKDKIEAQIIPSMFHRIEEHAVFADHILRRIAAKPHASK